MIGAILHSLWSNLTDAVRLRRALRASEAAARRLTRDLAAARAENQRLRGQAAAERRPWCGDPIVRAAASREADRGG